MDLLILLCIPRSLLHNDFVKNVQLRCFFLNCVKYGWVHENCVKEECMTWHFFKCTLSKIWRVQAIT